MSVEDRLHQVREFLGLGDIADDVLAGTAGRFDFTDKLPERTVATG